jgi:NitT/TauT family transport system substrate-binding protein
MKNKIILGLLILGVFIAVAFIGNKGTNGENDNLVKVRVADLPVVHALPLYVAMEKGYFEEAGIEIEYIKLNSPNLIIDAILSGQADMTSPSGAMGIAGLASFRQPDFLEIYAATGGDSSQRNEGLLVTPESTIKSFADLNGKKMGILPGIQWITISKHLLSTHDLVVGEDVILVELAPSLQVGALISGQIDALLAIEPMTTIAEKQGMVEIVKAPNLEAISNPFYPGAGVVRSEFANENPKVVDSFIEVIERALDDIENDPEGSRKYLSGYTPLSDELIPNAPIMVTKLSKDFIEEDVLAIETFHNIFTDYEVIDGQIDTRGIIYKSR